MKQGDLVRLNEFLYPQYKGMLGILGDINESNGSGWLVMTKHLGITAEDLRSNPRWIVFIDNKWHLYVVDQSSLELVNEAR
jgi:hypothetical protein